ncbi:SDR family oxidoreductase [Rhizocola hellebori]|nr:SDR family oxidoreductase [Rhizocola hellebori]
MTILITGANGTVSSDLLKALHAKTEVKLRALVRDAAKAPRLPGVEIAIGDLEEPGSLTEAFAGVDTLWLLNAMGPLAPHASSNALWAAKQAGVKHIVRLSAIGAGHDAPTRNGRLHALSDVELLASAIPATIVRPAFFMQNLLGAVAGDVLYHALGDGRISPIDTRDIADFAAVVLLAPEKHAGRTYPITGPESVSMAQVAATLSAQLGRPFAVQQMGFEDSVNAMVQAGFPRWVAEVSGNEYGRAYAGGWGDYTTADFAAVTGGQPRSIADFARDHAAQLGAGS